MSLPARLRQVLSLDVRSLALLRVGLGLVLLMDVAGRLPHLVEHYTDAGIVTRADLMAGGLHRWEFCLMLASGSAWFAAAFLALLAGAALCLVAGFFTRTATLVAWLLLVSIHARNPLLVVGGDILLRLVLFWGIFLPLGARWSVDAMARTPRIAPAAPDASTPDASAPPTPGHFSVGGVALVVQVFLLYCVGMLHKTGVEWWEERTAIYYALSVESESRLLGPVLLQFPALLGWMTAGVVWFEILGALLIFCPLWFGPVRCAVVAGFVAMHVGFLLTLRLGLFPWINIVAALALLPTWFWERVRAPVGRLADGVASVVAPVAAPLSRVAASLDARTAGLVAALARLRPAAQAFAALCLAYVLYYNYLGLDTADRLAATSVTERAFGEGAVTAAPPPRAVIPGWLFSFGKFFVLNQRFTMYAPSPSREDGWFLMPVILADGADVDLLRDGAGVSWAPPPSLAAPYRGFRDQTLMRGLISEYHARWRAPFLRHHIARWNASHPPARAVTKASLIYMLVVSLPDGATTRPRPVVLTLVDASP